MISKRILFASTFCVIIIIATQLLFSVERKQTPAELKMQIQLLQEELDQRKTPENLQRSYYEEYKLEQDNQIQKQFDDTRWNSEPRKFRREPIQRE